MKRIWVLPMAAIVIVALCAYKATRTYDTKAIHSNAATLLQSAPPFELFDQSKPSRRIRLESYLGRHQIMVVFFDSNTAIDKNPLLLRLRKQFERIEATDTKVIAVSAILPQEYRKAIARSGSFPFALLSDPAYDVHRAWGRFDEAAGVANPGVFLIDRAGHVGFSKITGKPEAMTDANVVFGLLFPNEKVD